jgi:DNA-directed RNA polymerase specialized sigma24 family protein
LNWLLDHLTHPHCDEQAVQTVRSGGRKERNRAKLRRLHLRAPDRDAGRHAATYAQLQLRAAKAVLPPSDWHFLRALGEGHRYDELAAALGVSPASLRIRALRLRRSIRSHIPDWWRER